MKEIELNSRSGDIECYCAMARKMTARSTSGDVTLQPETEKTAEKTEDTKEDTENGEDN